MESKWFVSFTLSVLLVFSVNAEPLISLTETPGIPFEGSSSDYTIGYSFIPAESRSVSSLGMYDQSGAGFGSIVNVGLWTSGGSPLGQITIPAGTSGSYMEDSFRYVDLPSSISLNAGETYVLGANLTTSIIPYLNSAIEGVNFLSDADIVLERYKFDSTSGGGGFQYPNQGEDFNEAFLGPNLLFTLFSSGSISIHPAVEIDWASTFGTAYQVQYSTNLVSTNWFNLGPTVIGNGSTNHVFDSTRDSGEKFYRFITIP